MSMGHILQMDPITLIILLIGDFLVDNKLSISWLSLKWNKPNLTPNSVSCGIFSLLCAACGIIVGEVLFL